LPLGGPASYYVLAYSVIAAPNLREFTVLDNQRAGILRGERAAPVIGGGANSGPSKHNPAL